MTNNWLFYFLALKNGKASQIVPIDRLSVVFTIILAFIILSEKVSIKTIIGGVTIVIGAILVALG
ncbi:MAG: EamA family transporter [Patescibacteria group bacterium]